MHSHTNECDIACISAYDSTCIDRVLDARLLPLLRAERVPAPLRSQSIRMGFYYGNKDL